MNESAVMTEALTQSQQEQGKKKSQCRQTFSVSSKVFFLRDECPPPQQVFMESLKAERHFGQFGERRETG